MAASLTALLALWIVFAAVGLAGTAIFAYQVLHFGRKRFALPSPPPAAAVIVPMKGASGSAAQCLAAILAQDYPAYRVVVAVESADDPACRLARDVSGRAGKRIDLVVAGAAVSRGQKVHNLLAALAGTSDADAILCFADADALWPADTLSTLVRELAVWDEPVLLSGYRWMFPAEARAGAIAASAANLSVAAAAKSPRWDLAWGGTMAARRTTFARVDVERLWDRSLSDDVPLSRTLRRSGLDVKLMPNLFVPSPGTFTLAEALGFARRQYAMLRLYSPLHWWFALAVYAVFFAGVGASAAAFASPLPAHLPWMAGLAWAIAVLRGLVQAAIAARRLPRTVSARLRPALLLDIALPVVPALLHAWGIVTSVRMRRLRWAGIAYMLDGSRVHRVAR